MTTETNDFIKSIMLLPKKPEYIGFTMSGEEVYEALLTQINKLFNRNDMRNFTGWDLHEESWEFMFHIYDEDLLDALGEEEFEDFQQKLPFAMDEYWEATAYFAQLHFQTPSWVSIYGRDYSNVVDVHIGLPKDL